jgi:hypothetical protein
MGGRDRAKAASQDCFGVFAESAADRFPCRVPRQTLRAATKTALVGASVHGLWIDLGRNVKDDLPEWSTSGHRGSPRGA